MLDASPREMREHVVAGARGYARAPIPWLSRVPTACRTATGRRCWSRGGAPSCVAFLALLTLLDRAVLWPRSRSWKHPAAGLLRYGPFAVGALVIASVDPMLQTPTALLLVACAAGLSVPAPLVRVTPASSGARSRWRLAVVGMYIPIMAVLTSLAWRRLQLPFFAATAMSPADLSLRTDPLSARLDEYALLSRMHAAGG